MKTNTFSALAALCMLFALSASAEDLSVKWSYGMNISARVVVVSVNVADYDGDGFKDIAVGAKEDTLQGSAGWVYLLNNDGTLKWEYDTPGAITAMISADLSGNGKPQIIVGVSSRLYIFDGAGNSKQISLGDLAYRAVAMAAEDVNNDGIKELVVIGGSQEKGKVFIFDKDGKLPYSQVTLGSPSAMALFDINGDGEKEIVVGIVGRKDDYPAYVQAFSNQGDKLWAYRTSKGIQSLAVFDADGDGIKEILAGSTGNLTILTPEGREKEVKSNITRPGYRFDRILADDMDGDGAEEVVLGCTNSVYIYDKTLNNLRWKNPVGAAVFDLVTQDVDGDGLKELLVASDNLYIYNKDGTEINRFHAGTSRFSVRDIYAGDLNEDTYPDIIIGSTDGRVYVLGSTTQAKKMDAANLYRRGREQYAERNYADAQLSMRAAMKAYKDLGDNTKAQEINDLLKRIMNDEAATANQAREAQEYLESAFSSYTSGDYMKAIENARVSRAKYANINPKDPQIDRLDSLINNSIENLGFAAESHLDNASACLERGDYENALRYAKKGFDIYSFIKDESGLAKSQGIIDAAKAEGATDETTSGEPNKVGNSDLSSQVALVALFAALLVAAFVAAYHLKGRKVKKRESPDDVDVLDKVERERARKAHDKTGKEHEKAHVHHQDAGEHANHHGHREHGHHHDKNDQHRHWVREAQEALKEPGHAEPHEGQAVFASGHPHHPAGRHRKKLKRITKDSYRGAGLSLRGISADAEKKTN